MLGELSRAYLLQLAEMDLAAKKKNLVEVENIAVRRKDDKFFGLSEKKILAYLRRRREAVLLSEMAVRELGDA